MDTGAGYTVYRMRFVVLAAFCLVQASNAIQWISFSAINSLSQVFFQVSSEKVNALSICFLALYLPGTLLSMWVFNKYSLRTGLLVGAVMTAVAGWIRYGSSFADIPSEGAYGGVLFGQCISGLAQPFFTNIPAKVGSRWFPVKQRDLATTVGAMFNPIGIAVGTVVASVFVSVGSTPTEVVGMSDWLLCQACVSTVAAILAFFTFQDRPETPPSASQESTVFHSLDAPSKPFKDVLVETWEQIVSCFKERDFVWLFCSFGIGLGIFNALTTVVEQITRPVCATTDDASLFAGLLIGLGLVGAGVFGYILDRTHQYRLALRIGFGGALLFIVVLTLVLRNDAIDAIAAMFALLGFFILPMLPTSFSAAAEVTFPVPEDVSSGLLMTAGQLTGIGFTFGLDALIPTTICSSNAEFIYPGSSVLLVVSVTVSVMFIFLFKDSNKRLRVDGIQGSFVGATLDSKA